MKVHPRIFLGILCVLAVRGACAQSAKDADIPAANPGRPTVSTPATLTPVGYLQFENGVFFADDSEEFSRRSSVGQVTKLAVASRLQVFAQTELYVHSTGDSGVENHFGDVFGGVQGEVLVGEGSRPTLSASYTLQFHSSPAPDIDIGSAHQGVALLLGQDLGGFHYDLNGIVNEEVQSGVRRAQFGQTLSVSHQLGQFTVAGEIWHFTQPFTQSNAVGNLWALSYQVRKNLVVDGGFNHGLTSTSTQWVGFGGFTYLLPHRLWKAR